MTGISARQTYALANPLNGPDQSTAAYTAVRVHARSFLFLSILAVIVIRAGSIPVGGEPT